MTDDKDGGKTVIRPMPGGAFGGGAARAKPPPPAGGQKTVIGGLPPAGAGFGAGAGAGAAGQPSPGGGFGPPPTPGQGGGIGFGGDDDFGGGSNAWMGAAPKQEGFFPDHRRPEPALRAAPAHKISLDAALSARTSGHSAEVNPITAAAASLLILFGRLRSQVVDMHAVPLMQHVTEEIDQFEKRVLAAGVDPTDALIAKYCLCGTADDIVQNLPGTDRGVWLQYSMVARFFNKRTSGVGFFQEVDKALQNPLQKYHLLELMLICLQLGFEGQYRAVPGGDVQLQGVKRGIYETLRRVKPRGDDDISPRWKGVEIAPRRNFRKLPVWIVACLAAALLAGSYFAMRTLLAEEGTNLAGRMTNLHPASQIRLVRSEEVPEYIPPAFLQESDQLERITAALTGEPVEISQKGDFIVLNVNNGVLFASGKSEVKPEFTPVAQSIAAALNDEPGPVTVIGHTDNIPLSGRGRFKDNFELSVARATSVAAILSPLLADPVRVGVDGRGEDEPIADNASAEGRAANRRVEIMLQREDTL
ncbi:MAG: hypothetical protein CL813_01445 [Confluentimicrobium sp.]|nr:hypothetical protein [Actibacterium sp.]